MDKIAQTFHDAHVRTFPLGPDGKTLQYPGYFWRMMNIVDTRAHQDCLCGWVAPYGFTIEEGCPEHD